MKKNIIFLIFILFSFNKSTYAENQYSFAVPSLDVSSYALMDVRTGSIIAGKNLDKKVEPASLTKIATL